MKYRVGPALLCLAASASLVCAEDAGVVNERPPLSRAALEAHWGVDCTVLRTQLLAWADAGTGAARSDWPEQARLCAAVHNPPGEARAAACPDFAAVHRTLTATADPVQQREQLRRALTCAP